MKKDIVCRTMSFALACLMMGSTVPFVSMAAEVKKEGSKSQETKTQETKAAETKTQDKKSTEAKPADNKNSAENKDVSKSQDTKTENKESDKKDDKNKITKDETVYVNLNPDGSLREVIITDKIHSDDPKAVVEDKSDLKDIEVIKGGSIKEQKDGKIIWQMEANDLYYRGKSTKKLPFDMSIKYFLDGKEMKPSKLAGKSGDLKITFDFKNNLYDKKEYKGKKGEFYSPMGIAALLTLPTENFKNVEGEDVAITTEGDNTIVAIASVPGLYKSLDLDNNKVKEIEDIELPEHFEITCKVENFKMNAIAVTATGGFPEDEDFNIDLDFIDELDENLQKVKRIKDSFDKMDDDRGLRDMLLDDEKLKDLQELSKDIDTMLSLNTSFANNLDKYITKDNIGTLSRLIDEIADIDLRYLKDFNYAEDYNESHSKPVNNDQLGKGVEKMLELMDEFNFDALNKAYQGQKKLAQNQAKVEEGCRQILTMTMGGNDVADSVIADLTVEEMLPLVAKISPQAIATGIIEKKYQEKLAEVAAEQGVTVDKLPPEVKKQIFEGVKAAVMGELQSSGLSEQAKELNKEARIYVAIQEELKPMMDATVALGEYPRDAYLKKMVHSMRDIYDDFLELYPTIALMKADLMDKNIKDSFDHSPEMIEILVRLKKQLDENESMSDTLRKLQDDKNIERIKDIVSTLDEIDRDELIDDYTDKINKLQDMVSRKDVLKDMAEANEIYTDKADNMETTYKFVLKTDEIEIPKEEEKSEVKEEVSGIKKFFANLFK